jgi:cysteine desulfurase
MPIYLDCNATTPMEPEVLEVVVKYMRDEYGNSGSRTHEYGARAKAAVERAREQVAEVVKASPDEIIFTSGATESNNLALLGLQLEGEKSGRKHIVSTAIEHKAVLEPLLLLKDAGFEITFVAPEETGEIDANKIAAALRPDTLAVSVMQVNNETGVIQPISVIAALLAAQDVYFHVDAAQGYGKIVAPLQDTRIDLLSVSAHKIHGPKGVGALIVRRRSGRRPPIRALAFGGGQERGLRAGTLPVPLIAGLGEASRIAIRDGHARYRECAKLKVQALQAFAAIDASINGSVELSVPHTLNVSIPGVDSEAGMLGLKRLAAISNGSACTSSSYTRSHVLIAMGLSPSRIEGALRFSWCHLTPDVSWNEIVQELKKLQ